MAETAGLAVKVAAAGVLGELLLQEPPQALAVRAGPDTAL
jgi:hypothetical protein